MKLSYLIKSCTPVWMRIIEPQSSDPMCENSDPDITSIHANASEVKPGGLFIAIKGFKADGHSYIGQAVANGAVAIVTHKKIEKTEFSELCLSHNVISKPVLIEVPDTRKAMSSIAARFYGNPSDSMVVVGVTGTNGKTTTAFLIESIFNACGYQTGVIGTVNFRYARKIFDNPVTTPESIDLQRILRQMKDAGVSHVVMEASSHAIDLHRVRDCSFDVGVFTNLTQDHLDYHKTMSAYFSCKKKFFTKQLRRGVKADKSAAVININNSYGQTLVDEICTKSILNKNRINIVTTEAFDNQTNKININIPHIFSSGIKDDISGLRGNIHILSQSTDFSSAEGITTEKATGNIAFESKLTGKFNLENILCAVGAANALGIPTQIIKRGIESCIGVPGRLERVENSSERYVFVDYAHTPDALESILQTLKLRAPARLISVFGCGGDRDRSKRPIMGQIACHYSDITIITSDNPRTEDPYVIIDEILNGIKNANAYEVKLCKESSAGHSECEYPEHFGKKFIEANMHQESALNKISKDSDNSKKKIVVEPDRAMALENAVIISNPGDIIVAAGKGHETYQITAQGKIDFDDRVILRASLAKHGFATEG